MMTRRIALAAATSAAALALSACELGGKQVEQTGYRGTGLEQIYDPDNFKAAAAIPATPYALPPDSGPSAAATYQNVQVLGDLSAERFNHLMASITQWVAPQQGCNYCHNPANLADDRKYTHRVARQMLQMTREINGTWASHVQGTGVTCWTCHRGNNIPENVWTMTPPTADRALRGNRRGQNAPDANVGYASLPTNAFASYFAGNPAEVRVASSSGYPSPRHVVSIKDAEQSYALMMHLSQSLGVNCTYCHNSQSFRSWSLSRGQRATAWYGIRMVRDINETHIGPLAGVLPANRVGPLGDPQKVNCLTCHQGQAKPLGGVAMLADYPYLRAPRAAPIATPEAAPGDVSEAIAEPEGMTGADAVPAPVAPPTR